MSKRRCSHDRCPQLIPAGKRYCPQHAREYERMRGSSTQRGYDAAYRRERKRWEYQVRRGTVHCWRCGQLITPHEPWDLGHDDHDRTIIRGPEHERCNRATQNRKPTL